MRRLLIGLLASLVLAPLPAHAAIPEGCVGFPDIPEAYVCITQFTPANQLPSPSQGGSTYYIPQFCAFDQCVGPTPVTVPTVNVAQGEGLIAEIYYNGQTYPVPVAQVPVMVFSGTLTVECFGCGVSTATFDGSFSGVIGGHSYASASMSGTIYANEPADATCNVTGSYSGTLYVSDDTRSDAVDIHWTAIGPAMLTAFGGAFAGTGLATRVMTSPLLVSPCVGGPPASMSVAGSGLISG